MDEIAASTPTTFRIKVRDSQRIIWTPQKWVKHRLERQPETGDYHTDEDIASWLTSYNDSNEFVLWEEPQDYDTSTIPLDKDISWFYVANRQVPPAMHPSIYHELVARRADSPEETPHATELNKSKLRDYKEHIDAAGNWKKFMHIINRLNVEIGTAVYNNRPSKLCPQGSVHREVYLNIAEATTEQLVTNQRTTAAEIEQRNTDQPQPPVAKNPPPPQRPRTPPPPPVPPPVPNPPF